MAGGVLAVLGGLVGAVSVLALPWASVSVPSEGLRETVAGTAGSDGYVGLALGGLITLAGVFLFLGTARRTAATLAVAAGLLLALLGTFHAVLARDVALEAYARDRADDSGFTVEEIRARLRDDVRISPSIGVFGLIVGGATGLAGGILGGRVRPRHRSNRA